MTEVKKDAPAEEDKKTNPEDKKTDPGSEGAKPEEKKEVKIGDALNTNPPKKKDEEGRMVPEAVLLEYKNANKELKKDIGDLKKLIESGASKQEISDDLKAIAEEHNVDEAFLSKLVKALNAQAEANVEKKLKPLEEKEKAEKITKVFNEHYDKVLEEMPEYKSIVQKDVIKALSLDPANANKTFAQIMEQAYGHLIKGKKTIESTTPRGGAKNDAVDFERAKNDSEYFKEIMADPQLKKEYNENLPKRLKL